MFLESVFCSCCLQQRLSRVKKVMISLCRISAIAHFVNLPSFPKWLWVPTSDKGRPWECWMYGMSYGICPTIKVANGSEEQRSVQWICCMPNKKKTKHKDFQSFNSKPKPACAVSVCPSLHRKPKGNPHVFLWDILGSVIEPRVSLYSVWLKTPHRSNWSVASHSPG